MAATLAEQVRPALEELKTRNEVNQTEFKKGVDSWAISEEVLEMQRYEALGEREERAGQEIERAASILGRVGELSDLSENQQRSLRTAIIRIEKWGVASEESWVTLSAEILKDLNQRLSPDVNKSLREDLSAISEAVSSLDRLGQAAKAELMSDNNELDIDSERLKQGLYEAASRTKLQWDKALEYFTGIYAISELRHGEPQQVAFHLKEIEKQLEVVEASDANLARQLRLPTSSLRVVLEDPYRGTEVL